jgi:hypothetical protein
MLHCKYRRDNMEDELISKKDLLDLTGISYGQLYRWKRKNLIPEEWFIKKSTFTGQETFFLRDKMLERIDKIKNMKDDLSLDDLANMFSPNLSDILLNKTELIKKNIVSQMTLDIYLSLHEDIEIFSFEKILYIAVLEKFLQAGAASLEEGKIILQNLEDNYKNFNGKECEMIFIRKFGIATCLLISVPSEIYLEKSSKLIERINISNLIEELKIKISI